MTGSAVLFAVALVVAGFLVWRWHSISTSLDRMSSVSDEATIVDIREHTSREGRKGHKRTVRYYRPVVEFEDSDHIKHTAESQHESTSSSHYHKGKAISVRYDPRDPESGVIIVGEEGKISGDALSPLIVAVAVVFMSAIPLVTAVAYRMQEKKGKPSDSE